MFCYPASFEKAPETGAVLVGFPDIPFCHSVGGRCQYGVATKCSANGPSRKALPSGSSPRFALSRA